MKNTTQLTEVIGTGENRFLFHPDEVHAAWILFPSFTFKGVPVGDGMATRLKPVFGQVRAVELVEIRDCENGLVRVQFERGTDRTWEDAAKAVIMTVTGYCSQQQSTPLTR